MPFYADGHRPDAPVFGLGGPMPYVEPDDAATARPDVSGGRTGGLAEASRALGRIAPVYGWTRPGMLSAAVRGLPARIWVTNTARRAVELIDPETLQVVRRLRVGNVPREIVPSWDLRTLWISDGGGTLVPMDARTGRRGAPVAVASPHDLYFTPDGRTALVMTGTLRRIDFRDPRTMRLHYALRVPCDGVGHADFSATGDYVIATCERSGQVVRVDPRRRTVTGVLLLHRRAAPKDVRLSPDGTVFYVSDPVAEGVWVIDAERFGKLGFIRTGPGAGGLTPSRDGTILYVSGRGTISLIDFAARRVVGRWRLPNAGSTGMGGVSADGKVLWLPGRSPDLVYAISTETGRPVHAIRAGTGAVGLCVFPQPGRYSLGHTGNFR
ncbi:hypothetical protein GCM10009780_25550 [Actinomadura alba]